MCIKQVNIEILKLWLIYDIRYPGKSYITISIPLTFQSNFYLSKSSINTYIYMLLKALSQVNVIHVKIY